ncbi:MAG: hypothetical protein H7Y36_09075 [Armatimonadetes bacterium]|nr:hypothetical protein [Akkermansiaceae bacterium]
MKKILLAAGMGALGFWMVSCAPSTPAYRISQRPQVFENLSGRQKGLVENGEIEKGMGKDAVLLAWGSPSSSAEGFRSGKRMERWDYAGSTPVVSNHFFGGYGYGAYGPYRYSGLGGGFGPEISYVPYRKSSVWFVGGRVDEWEKQSESSL